MVRKGPLEEVTLELEAQEVLAMPNLGGKHVQQKGGRAAEAKARLGLLGQANPTSYLPEHLPCHHSLSDAAMWSTRPQNNWEQCLDTGVMQARLLTPLVTTATDLPLSCAAALQG